MPKTTHVHFVGIKGVGMAGLAIIAQESGLNVTGSDLAESFVTDKLLNDKNIPLQVGFREKNLEPKPDLIVVSGAYGADNPEVKAALKKKIPLVSYGEYLSRFFNAKKGIAVGGAHGKTTIVAMLATIFKAAGMDVGYLIGAGSVPNLGSTAHWGKNQWFVAEADEYRTSPTDERAKFLFLAPSIAVVTSIEFDHPDQFTSEEAVYQAFYRLACRVPRDGLIVAGSDSPKVKKLTQSLADRRFITYGVSRDVDHQLLEAVTKPGTLLATYRLGRRTIEPLPLKIPGKFNALNALAAYTVAREVGVSEGTIRMALTSFTGVGRRFERLAEAGGVTLIDDYAHHPTEIAATLTAAREFFPKRRLICIFQPHTFSRTQALFHEFARALSHADLIVLTEIYGSAREGKGTISSEDLARRTKEFTRHVLYVPQIHAVAGAVKSRLQPGDVVITMGAGNINEVAYKLKELLG